MNPNHLIPLNIPWFHPRCEDTDFLALGKPTLYSIYHRLDRLTDALAIATVFGERSIEVDSYPAVVVICQDLAQLVIVLKQNPTKVVTILQFRNLHLRYRQIRAGEGFTNCISNSIHHSEDTRSASRYKPVFLTTYIVGVEHLSVSSTKSPNH